MTRATSRRALLAGLAAAPMAGLPRLAEATAAADPCLAALAQLRAAQVREAAARAAFRQIEAVIDSDLSAYPPVRFGGVEFRTLAHFDHECSSFGVLSLFARDPKVAEMRAALQWRVQVRKASERRYGFAEADEAWDVASDDQEKATERALATAPSSPAGALALLRLVAELADGGETAAAKLSGAIERVVAALERFHTPVVSS